MLSKQISKSTYLNLKTPRKMVIALVGSLVAMTQAEVATKHFGWINVDYGQGNAPVYSDSMGNDALGTAQMALGTKATVDNLTFVGVIGSDAMSFGGAGGKIGIADAFIDWSKIGGSGFGASFGAQAFLFGLKANGFPGDRSIQAGVEFGGAGGKKVSQQAGPSIKLRYEIMDKATATVGLFDTDVKGKAGSSIMNNQFVDITFHDLGVTGIYGFAGYERVYVGGLDDESKPIIDGGLGFKMAMFDISGEYIMMDKAWAGTKDDESYIVTELTITPMPALSIYADYSMADQIEASTIRAGVTFKSHEALTWMLEYSTDMVKGTGDDPMAVIGRANFAF